VKKFLFLLLFVLACSEEPAIQKLIVDVKPVNGGMVSQSYGEYQLNEEISLIASPNPEFEFNNWFGDYLSNNNPLNVVMNKDVYLTANFQKIEYDFKLFVTGSGSVSQSTVQSGGSRPYSSGTVLELNAIPETDWSFKEWKGDITSNSNPIQITIDSNKSVEAVFSQNITGKNAGTYLALGDSYTIGEGVNYDERWPVQLLKELNKTNSKINNVEFIAKTGATSSELYTAINNSNLEPPYGLISILIGVNNQFQGKSQQEFKDDFIKIINKSIALLNGNKERLFVLSIPDWGATPFGSAYNRTQVSNQINQFNSIVKSESESRGIKFFNITDISRQALYDSSLIASDGLHPSGKMYTLWVDRVIEYVSNLKY
jgi:acyl-CoA thioesterase-1